MTDLIYLGLIILIAAAFGAKVLKLCSFSFDAPQREFIFSAALGLGILGYMVLAIGLAGWLYKWVAHLLLILLFIISIGELKVIISALYGNIKDFVKGASTIQKIDPISLCLISILGLHVILNFLSCLAPPSAVDPLTYQLALPKAYINEHRIGYMPETIFSSFPFMLNMLYLFGMLLSSGRLPALIHSFFGILILGTIFSLCRKRFKENISLLAAAIFYTLPIVTFEATSAFVDLGLTVFGFLALYAFLEWQARRETRWIVLSGVFSGFAAGTKYLGLTSILAISIMLLMESLSIKKFKFKYAAASFSKFFLASILVACPWYIKSWVFTGNPLFPFFFRFFGGKNWNTFSAETLTGGLYNYGGMGSDLKSFILCPWNITLHGRVFDNGEWLGPLFLSFLPLLIFFYRDNKSVRTLFVYSAIYYPFWFFISQQAKFLIPLLVVLSIIASYVIFRLFEFGRIMRYAVAGTLFIFFLFNSSVNAVFSAQFLPVVFGLKSEDEFLSEKTELYNEIMYINQNLPETSKLLIWTHNRFYLDRKYIPVYPIEQGLIDYNKYRNAEELLSRLKELGITHILKPERTELADIQNCPLYMRQLYRLQYEMEKRHLKPVYKKKSRLVKHRTLSRGVREVDVFIYEIIYP